MIGLTKRQAQLLAFIKDYIARYGVAPTVQEMVDGMGGKSKSPTAVMLRKLEERGHIRRMPDRARAVEIVERGHPVNLNPEIHRIAKRYAEDEHITLDVAVNELLRGSLGAVR